MSPACSGDKQLSGIATVRTPITSAPIIFCPASVTKRLVTIVAVKAAPVRKTTTLPTRRRCATIAAVSATAIGLLIGGRLFRIVAALYSLSRSSVANGPQSGHVAQCCITADCGRRSRNDPVASSVRHSAQVIAIALYRRDDWREGCLESPSAP